LEGGGISTVLFDLDGTLRHSNPNGFEAFAGFLAELGHPLAAERLKAGHRWVHYYWGISPELMADIRELGDDTPEFWRRHTERQLRAVGVDGELADLTDQIGRLFEARYRPAHLVPTDVIPTLRRLRELGYTVGLVSNRRDPLAALCAELGLDDHFQFTLSAGEAASFKPDPGIFLKAVELAGCTPETAAYVGDNYYADVVGARAAGLSPILIDPLGIFPDAGCATIRYLRELEATLTQISVESTVEPSG
jgi:HAD superfamily hydrolase (TIGR01549 family)